MADVLVDTDVFIDHLRGHHALDPGGDRLFYSFVTRAELFAGRETDEQPVALSLAPFTEVGLDRVTAEEAGRLRRAYAVSLPDALVAATAVSLGLLLWTRNRRDFEQLPGVHLR